MAETLDASCYVARNTRDCHVDITGLPGFCLSRFSQHQHEHQILDFLSIFFFSSLSDP